MNEAHITSEINKCRAKLTRFERLARKAECFFEGLNWDALTWGEVKQLTMHEEYLSETIAEQEVYLAWLYERDWERH